MIKRGLYRASYVRRSLEFGVEHGKADMLNTVILLQCARVWS